MFTGIVEFLGWFGAVTVLAGYILFSTGKLQNGPAYQLLNLAGGAAIAVNVGAHHALPSLLVNAIWATVAAVVLTRMVRARRSARRGARVPESSALAEPPATTAVLPVIGPAVHDRGPAVADRVADHPAPAPVSAPAPMTETVPVITATIALALVAAAQHEHAIQHEHAADHEHAVQHEHAVEPEHAAQSGHERVAH